MSTGLTCVLLIYLWVNDEMSVDRFHELDRRLFHVMVNNTRTEGIETSLSTQAILADAVKEEPPQIEYSEVAVGSTIDFTFSIFYPRFHQNRFIAIVIALSISYIITNTLA